jgi:hypothetical protein
MKSRHLVLFAAKASASVQLFFKTLPYQIHPAFLHSDSFNHLGFGYVGD